MGTLSDADALAQVADRVKKRSLDMTQARYVAGPSGERQSRVYTVPNAAGLPKAHVALVAVASKGSSVPDRWIIDSWEYCN